MSDWTRSLEGGWAKQERDWWYLSRPETGQGIEIQADGPAGVELVSEYDARVTVPLNVIQELLLDQGWHLVQFDEQEWKNQGCPTLESCSVQLAWAQAKIHELEQALAATGAANK